MLVINQSLSNLINIDTDDYIGLDFNQVVTKIDKSITDIINISLAGDKSHDTIRQAYDNICQYMINLEPVYDIIIDTKTSLYMYNRSLWQAWDDCLYNIRRVFDQAKNYLLDLYKGVK